VDLSEAEGLEGIDELTEPADVGLDVEKYDCSDGTGEQASPSNERSELLR